jgi:hypothetical protein
MSAGRSRSSTRRTSFIERWVGSSSITLLSFLS